ncbi:MAG: hypothetical protein KKA79_01420 [Nanoarchaeota archaeon]|nr:hypothetical protein [Nanoarchaeota archaeon]
MVSNHSLKTYSLAFIVSDKNIRDIGTTAPTHGLNVFAASPLNVTRSGGTAGIVVGNDGSMVIRLG